MEAVKQATGIRTRMVSLEACARRVVTGLDLRPVASQCTAIDRGLPRLIGKGGHQPGRTPETPPAEVAVSMRRLLGAINAGELTCPPASCHRLEA
jgi:hypothetical protein